MMFDKANCMNLRNFPEMSLEKLYQEAINTSSFILFHFSFTIYHYTPAIHFLKKEFLSLFCLER